MRGASGLLLVAFGVTLLYIAATGRWACMTQAMQCLGRRGGSSSSAAG